MSGSTSEMENTQGANPTEGEEAVDSLAFLLRTLGRYSFDTATTTAEALQSDLEAWARHILVGSSAPGLPTSGGSGGPRDWKELCRFVSERRRDEVDYVVQSSSDLRASLWMFIQGMARAIPNDRSSTQTMRRQLDKIRTCLDSSDTTEIRRVTSASIDVIEESIRDQIERNASHLELLADQIRRVSDELMIARERFARDELTGLFDRPAFDEFIWMMTHLGMLSGQDYTLFRIAIDDFKWLIDRPGPTISDAVLKEIAVSSQEHFARRSDFVARYSEDELAVIVLTESTAVDERLGEELVFRVRDMTVPDGNEEIRVTISIGSARLRGGEGSDEWLDRSNRALHTARVSGHDRHVLASDLTDAESAEQPESNLDPENGE